MIDRSQRLAARVFAITTLLIYVVIGIAYSRFYAPFLAWEHEAQTALNFIAHEPLVHVYIAAAVVYGLGAIVVLTALYVVFTPVSTGLALFAVFTRLIYAVMWFILLIDHFAALHIMGGRDFLHVFESERLQALAGLQLASGWDAYYIGLTFYAIGSVLYSYLFFKSRYIPRTLAVLGIVAAVFEWFCGFAYLIDRNFESIVSVKWYEMPVVYFEVALSIWILVRGLRVPETAKAIRSVK